MEMIQGSRVRKILKDWSTPVKPVPHAREMFWVVLAVLTMAAGFQIWGYMQQPPRAFGAWFWNFAVGFGVGINCLAVSFTWSRRMTLALRVLTVAWMTLLAGSIVVRILA